MLKINSLLNNIKTEENLNNNNSNLKKLFYHYQKEISSIKRKYQLLNDNFNFCYSGEDLLRVSDYSEDLINKLESFGFKETTIDNYSNEEYNEIFKIEEVKHIRNNIKKEKISFFNGIENIELEYLFEEDTLIFYNQLKVYFEFNLNKYTIKDIFIKDEFVYLLLKDSNYHYIALTSLSHYINDIKKNNLFMIKTQYDFDKFININSNQISVLNYNSKKIYKLFLGKKYYFEFDNKIYFKENYKTKELGFETIQVENLFLYDVLHLFGLSDYKINNLKFFNSINFNKKNLLYINLYNDTLNGLINFHNKQLNNSIQNNILEITGNLLINNLPKDIMNLKIYKQNKNITLELYYNNKLIKYLNTKEKEKIYFANLCIETKVYTEENYSFEFNIKNNNLNINELILNYNSITNNTNNYINNINNNFIENSFEKVISSFELTENKIKDLNLLIDNEIKHFDEIIISPNAFIDNNKDLNFDVLEKKLKINYKDKKKKYLKIKKHQFSYRLELE